ncbi:hypothetical protein RRG08_051866 [Elysia crispata]|uniref:Uncharacterized protein n=1 Tax=Elysia crispata TaxID=231223 RepID=A0AAE1DCD0_9GAST|nr:hypothetical protein RRG08_051866 [Elysia crispata]
MGEKPQDFNPLSAARCNKDDALKRRPDFFPRLPTPITRAHPVEITPAEFRLIYRSPVLRGPEDLFTNAAILSEHRAGQTVASEEIKDCTNTR